MKAILAVLFVILKWLGIVIAGLVGLGVLLLVIMIIMYLCTDDIVYDDNLDEHIICGITNEPCIKMKVCAGICINCPIYQEDEDHE